MEYITVEDVEKLKLLLQQCVGEVAEGNVLTSGIASHTASYYRKRLREEALPLVDKMLNCLQEKSPVNVASEESGLEMYLLGAIWDE